MIINLTGKPNNKDEIEFDTQDYFDRYTDVTLTQVYLGFSKLASEVHKLICSSVVNKCQINQKQ